MLMRNKPRDLIKPLFNELHIMLIKMMMVIK